MLILMKTVGHVLLMQLAMLDRLEETMLQLFLKQNVLCNGLHQVSKIGLDIRRGFGGKVGL